MFITSIVDLSLFLRGLVIGFSIAAPVGPIGILCIRRTLAEGRAAGFVAGLGAATADAVYGAIAGLGLSFVANALIGQSSWLRLVGGVFLCSLGIKAFFARPAERPVASKGSGLTAGYLSTFLLTLTNPMTILSFTAIFVGLGIATTASSRLAAATLVAGVFLGSTLWWFILSSGAALFRTRLTPGGLRWVNRVAGLVILGAGLAALLVPAT